MTHFAIPPGASSLAEHELAAIIDRESAMLRALSLRPLGRPADSQWRVIVLIVPLTIGFEADERWTR